MWRWFEIKGMVHVVPVNTDGKPLAPHMLDEFCKCVPEAKEYRSDGKLIIIHNQVN